MAEGRIDYLAGKVKVDEYVTHTRKFEEIQGGFHDMHVSTCVEKHLQLLIGSLCFKAGDCIRCVVDMTTL